MAIIEVKHLHKVFGDLEVLKDISFNVEEGEVICLIGPSGSGKSTLLRCLNKLEEKQDGDIVILVSCNLIRWSETACGNCPCACNEPEDYAV